MERIASDRAWQDGAVFDRDALGTAAHVEQITNLLRQTRVANTALGKMLRELDPYLTDGEKADIAEARVHIARICEALEIAKKRGRALAGERKKREEDKMAAVRKAVNEVFAPVIETIEDRVLLGFHADPNGYSIQRLQYGESMKREFRHWNGKMLPRDILEEDLESASQDALQALCDKAFRTIQRAEDAPGAVWALHAEFTASLPRLRVDHAALLQRIKTELVARELERSNRPPS